MKKTVKILLHFLPYLLVAWGANRTIYAYRVAPGKTMADKFTAFVDLWTDALTTHFFPTFHNAELWGGLAVALVVYYFVWDNKRSKKKFRQGKEYGSAAWGKKADIEPFCDMQNADNNIILTQTERLTMDKGAGANDRNKNVLVIGGSGSGKTRFFVKPNLMQMHSSYVVTDPKGSVLEECGEMLRRGGYKIKIFNTVKFSKSMHYNPFAYFRPESLTEDIQKFIDVFMANTSSKNATGDDFWNKAEKLLYTAYIAMIFTVVKPEQRNMLTLSHMVTLSDVREDDPSYQNSIDLLFEAVEKTLNGTFDPDEYEGLDVPENLDDVREIGEYALEFYRAYKNAAGKTAKSILISCSSRLQVFNSKAVAEITSRDDLSLDTIGDRKTAFFIVISDTNSTYNFLVAILYSQMFDLLCDKAASCKGNRLPVHVRCILDEFANIGVIPDFEKKISVFRSREISACVILQAVSQIKALYKDNADTIIGNCDTMLFLGSPEMPTLKMVSEMLGKETIDTVNTSLSRGTSGSFSTSNQRTGRELMTPDELRLMDGRKCILLIRGVRPFFSMKFNLLGHKRYVALADSDEKNRFDVVKFVKISPNHAKIGKEEVFSMYMTE